MIRIKNKEECRSFLIQNFSSTNIYFSFDEEVKKSSCFYLLKDNSWSNSFRVDKIPKYIFLKGVKHKNVFQRQLYGEWQIRIDDQE